MCADKWELTKAYIRGAISTASDETRSTLKAIQMQMDMYEAEEAKNTIIIE